MSGRNSSLGSTGRRLSDFDHLHRSYRDYDWHAGDLEIEWTQKDHKLLKSLDALASRTHEYHNNIHVRSIYTKPVSANNGRNGKSLQLPAQTGDVSPRADGDMDVLATVILFKEGFDEDARLPMELTASRFTDWIEGIENIPEPLAAHSGSLSKDPSSKTHSTLTTNNTTRVFNNSSDTSSSVGIVEMMEMIRRQSEDFASQAMMTAMGGIWAH